MLVKRNLIDAIKTLRQEYNTTLILTTHAMSDIELLCSRVIILDAGKILYDGTLDDIKHLFGDKRNVTIQTPAPIDATAAIEKFEIEKVSTESDGLLTTFTVDALKTRVDALLNFLLNAYKVDDIKLSETGIEQVVEKIYADRGMNTDGIVTESGGSDGENE